MTHYTGLAKQEPHPAPLFMLYDGKPIQQWAWDQVKPQGGTK